MKDYDEITDNLRLYFKEISSCSFLTKEEEQRLTPRINEGDTAAINKLALGCVQYVVSEALKRRWSGLPLTDLIGEGNVGLLEAARRYDGLKYDNRFISYARWLIRQKMDEAIREQTSALKIRVKDMNQFIEIKRTISRLEQVLGEKPSIEDIAEFTGFSEEEVREGLNRLDGIVSLDDFEYEEKDGRTKSEVIGDPKNTPEGIYSRVESREVVDIVNTLTERQVRVLSLYYGLNGEPDRKFEEIGDILGGITGERAKQIKNVGLERLRHTSRGRYLREFYDEI